MSKEKKDGLKTCYYEVLGVERKCEADDIKKAYRKLALKMHPDKAHLNNLSTEEATTKFQEIQEAYSVLSDPQERSWYDGHREQILRGGDGPGEDPFKTRINLYKYFSTSCYKSFSDQKDGFFKVYAELFEAIDEEEKAWEDAEDEEHVPMPPFGTSTSANAVVSKFYKNWLDFCSRKAFGHADKWNPATAPNRQVRRAMEQENREERKAAKKEFNAEVRQLVAFVQKRDPRYAELQRQIRQQAIDKEERIKQEKEEKKAKARQAAEEARLEEQRRFAEYEAERAARIERGEDVTDDESSEDDSVQFRCEACRKSFKSEKAFDQHTQSKKHLQLVAKLRSTLSEDFEDEAADDKEEEQEEDLGRKKKQKGQKGQKGKKAKGKKVDEDDEAEEDEDAEEPAKGASAASSAFRPPSRVPEASTGAKVDDEQSGSEDATDESKDGDEYPPMIRGKQASHNVKEQDGDESSSEDEESPAVPQFQSKKTQKKNRQKAALLEKAQKIDDDDGSESEGGRDSKEQVPKALSKKQQNREREREKQKALADEKKAAAAAVQELVDEVRKAQREAKKGAGEGSSVASAADVDEADHCPPVRGGSQHAPAAAKKKGKNKGGEEESSVIACGVCGEVFESRTKLFAHIRSSGHAVLKVMPEPVSAKGKNSKKKK